MCILDLLKFAFIFSVCTEILVAHSQQLSHVGTAPILPGCVVHQAWQQEVDGSPLYCVTQWLKATKMAIKEWNKEVFGPIQSQIQASKAKLTGAHIALQTDPLNSSLIKQELEARAGYQQILHTEEDFLRQKSRHQRLALRDSNSKFFYSTMKPRVSRKTGRKLRTRYGTYSEDPELLKSTVVHYFQALLNRGKKWILCHSKNSKSQPHKWRICNSAAR
ncbi:hypothetical protein QJS10_CPB15g02007 [Acorus calamus]|uniref:Uncharacterized protein n=1 Tax=Acorus calamus TaxID=4465 RepID=A0AAV9D8Y9_ACOCL|nr:hypothetical protein QJS10_CPB15g02007 [Acorus calamus]